MSLNNENAVDEYDNSLVGIMGVSNTRISSQGDSLKVVDLSNNTCIDAKITITTSPTILKVGAENLSNRKYIIFQALNGAIDYGFNASCNFTLMKNQLIMLPIANANIYLKCASGTRLVAIGELA